MRRGESNEFTLLFALRKLFGETVPTQQCVSTGSAPGYQHDGSARKSHQCLSSDIYVVWFTLTVHSAYLATYQYEKHENYRFSTKTRVSHYSSTNSTKIQNHQYEYFCHEICLITACFWSHQYESRLECVPEIV